MIVSIHQPSYFPWLGLLDKINKSDLYILLDNIQFSDSGYQNRNIFLDNQNKEQLLTIPVNKKNHLNKLIKDIEISNNIWQKKHNKFLYFNYKKHPFFDEIYPLIQDIYKKEYKFLIDILYDTMLITKQIFQINTKIIYASELDLSKELKKEELVIEILKKTSADTYLSGNGAKSYQKDTSFLSQNIKLTYQSFSHPIYSQHNNNEFHPGLSSLDAAFNLGTKDAYKILEGRS